TRRHFFMSRPITLDSEHPAPVIIDGQQLLTIPQAGDFLQVNDYTVRRMISRGELKAVKFGRNIRIKTTDLLRALNPVHNATDYLVRGAHVAKPACPREQLPHGGRISGDTRQRSMP